MFQYYCLYGEPLNTNKLKSSKYLKLLRDSQILLKGVLKITANQSQNVGTENFNQTNRKALNKQQLGITQIEADLIFKKLTKDSQQVGRMDFDQFFKSIILIAQKIFTNCDIRTSMELLCTKFITPIEDMIALSGRGESNNQISQLMEVLKDEYMVEILSCVHRTLIPYYHFYAHQKTGLLTFD